MKDVLSVVLGALATLAVLAGPAPGEEDEKLLFGFERGEAEAAMKGKKERFVRSHFKMLENGDFQFFNIGISRDNTQWEVQHIMPMNLVKEKASQGTYSLKSAEPFDRDLATYPMFRLPRLGVLPLYRGESQVNPRLGELLNTMGWFKMMFPEDWSGYDLLRVDVLLQSSESRKLLLEVEDDMVEPPVSLTYDAPASGSWVTLEMDLAKAVRERGLNPAKMRNIWVRHDLKDTEKSLHKANEYRKNREGFEKVRIVAYLDNIRLARKGAPCATPVLKGVRSPYTATLPRSYAVAEQLNRSDKLLRFGWPRLVPADKKMPKRATVEPETEPVTLSDPMVVPIRDMLVRGCLSQKERDKARNAEMHSSVRLTCTSAVDSRRIIVGFYLTAMRSLRANPTAERPAARECTAAVATTDGGVTWKGLDGTEWPTVLGGNITKPSPCAVDLDGDIMGIYPFGCSAFANAHAYYPMDRVFFTRCVFTGERWWMSPRYFVSGDPRHCHDVRSGDVVKTPSGRIWAAWTATNREGGGGRGHSASTCAYYSDDGGVTWLSWRGPGIVGKLPEDLRKVVRLAPYGGRVAAFSRDKWTRFDGKTWSAPEKTGLAGRCWYAISCGDEIFLSGENGPARWYDGTAWHDFTVPGRTGKRGKLGVCGDRTFVFAETDADETSILCWRRPRGGEWQGPQKLLTEKTKIVKITHQRYAPAGFLPIAYMCLSSDPSAKTPKHTMYNGAMEWDPWKKQPYEPWIKVLRVPVVSSKESAVVE